MRRASPRQSTHVIVVRTCTAPSVPPRHATVPVVRVVAGTARGRRLVAPKGSDVRPTTDRVREALFNALGSLDAVEGARVLDLFAGTGALGIEALSRGARHAVFVDRSRTARAAIEANLAATDLAGAAHVVVAEAEAYLGSGSGPFDLVLLDPPYGRAGWDDLLAATAGVAAPDAVVVAESEAEVAFPDGWRVERRKRYGSTFVAIARPPAGDRSSHPEPP